MTTNNKVTIYDEGTGETHEYDGPLDSAIGAEVSRFEDAVGGLSDIIEIKARERGEWRSHRVRVEYVRRIDVTGSAPCDDPTEDGGDDE